MPSIELIAVVPDQAYMDATARAMIKSYSVFPHFDKLAIICPPNRTVNDWSPFNIRVADFSFENYSEFMVKKLVNYMECDYCLCMQWDSCIIDASKWTEEFLDYHYIGACWTNPFVNRVGNGGYSLRHYKFLEESAKLDYIKTDNPIANNEDIVSCVINYEKMVAAGVKFAPISLARQFSVERPILESPHDYEDINTYNSFGAHGQFNSGLMRFINDTRNT